MPRFRDRSSRLLDIPDRFEAQPSSVHAYKALGAIGRLRDDGDTFWGDGSSQNTRWKEYCMVLYRLINRLGERRYIEEQSLETLLREFIQEFEHSISGMYEMLYGTASAPDDSEHIQQITDWFNLSLQAIHLRIGLVLDRRQNRRTHWKSQSGYESRGDF